MVTVLVLSVFVVVACCLVSVQVQRLRADGAVPVVVLAEVWVLVYYQVLALA